MGMSQEDSCEAFLKMIDLLHVGLSYKVKMSLVKKGATDLDRLSFEAWNQSSRAGYSIIMKLFYGQLLNRTKCDECHKESYRFDMFNVLNFPITNSTNTLFDSIGHYVISENMRGENRIECENCGGLRSGKIKKSVYIPPPVLVFCFNRFDNDGHKISKRIDFPIDNVRFPMLFEKPENHTNTYDLVGIGNHSGNLLGGHYWAYCRSGSRWIKADDETISDISWDSLVSSNSYYLVYQRRGINQHFIESS
jgi:ubiquitin C-terminal hydrolase